VKRKRDNAEFRFVNPGTDGCTVALIEELQKKIAEKQYFSVRQIF
jgi:hypothetical protein